MEQYFTFDNLTIWIVFSVLVFLLWCLMMGDPAVSHTSNIIITIVCAILALPVTIVILLILLIIGYATRETD